MADVTENPLFPNAYQIDVNQGIYSGRDKVRDVSFPDLSTGAPFGWPLPESSYDIGLNDLSFPGTGNEGTIYAASNPEVTSNIYGRLWHDSLNYHQYLRKTEYLFNYVDRSNPFPLVLSVAQVNDMLLRAWKTLMDSKPATINPFDDSVMRRKSKQFSEIADLYFQHGEIIFTDKKLCQRIHEEAELECFKFLSSKMILESFTKLGLYMSDKGLKKENRNGSLLYTVTMGGVSSGTHVANYWGDVQDNSHLFWLIKRKIIGENADGNAEYGEFFLSPYFASSIVIPPPELYYQDIKGEDQYGKFMYVGQVIPDYDFQPNNEIARQQLCGLINPPSSLPGIIETNTSNIRVRYATPAHWRHVLN